MRVLSLGISPNNRDARFHEPNERAPTIYDYDMVIVDSASIDVGTFWKKSQQFIKFFKNGGICFVFLSPEKIVNVSNKNRMTLDFLPISDNIQLTDESGDWIDCKLKEAEWLFDTYNFTWSCYVDGIPEEHKIIATNKVKDPVSFLSPIYEGYCIFLPRPNYSEKSELVDALIEEGLDIIPDMEDSITIPDWIDQYATENERELLIQKENIEKKLGRAGKIKPLLYETGKKLEKIVMDTFIEIGIEIEVLPEGSHADFEFPLSNNQTAVCEIKGLLSHANIQHLRQLLQYYIDQRDIEKRDVKGIFIVNAFRGTAPSERDAPLTKDAIELVEKHDFKVVTTVEIYNYLTQDFDELVSKEEFISNFFL